MLPIKTIHHFLKYFPDELCEIVLELRNLVAAAASGATEDIRPNGLVYYFGDLGGPVSAGICGITVNADHVRLYFTHGAFIPDPQGLLQGSGKAMRFIRLEEYRSIPWEDIQALIAEHANFDPRSFKIL